jgi:hypothetical protein
LRNGQTASHMRVTRRKGLDRAGAGIAVETLGAAVVLGVVCCVGVL